MEGAAVLLDGSYKLHGGELDFCGNLELQAKLSETVTGVKSVLLKPIDPFFKKGRTGAVIPIAITGTRDNPIFAVSIFLSQDIQERFGCSKTAALNISPIILGPVAQSLVWSTTLVSG